MIQGFRDIKGISGLKGNVVEYLVGPYKGKGFRA